MSDSAHPRDIAGGAVKVVGGTVVGGYEKVRDAFVEGQTSDEGGAQLCIYRHGERVVDLWIGWDPVKNRPFDGDSVTILMSCSKGVTATCAHMLVQRGLLDLDAPVARYWPEFAANGKADIPVRWLLSHRAGIPDYPPESGIQLRELLDWERCAKVLAGATPVWKPGTEFAYHSLTFGNLVGEVIHRVSGKLPGQFLADEVAGPLKLDLYLGTMSEVDEGRFAPGFQENLDPESKAFNELANSRQGHLAQVPSGNVIGNGRALAKLYAATIGEIDGLRLMNAETVNNLRRPQTDGLPMWTPEPEPRLKFPLRFGLGYELDRAGVPMLGQGSFGHSGWGGRLGFAHPESGIAVGFVVNHINWDSINGPDARWVGWTRTLKEIVLG